MIKLSYLILNERVKCVVSKNRLVILYNNLY